MRVLKFISIMFMGLFVGSLIIQSPVIAIYDGFTYPFKINWMFTIADNLLVGLLPILIVLIKEKINEKKASKM